jgi:hypothetical protein
MWMYLGPSCPDRPFFEELGNAEINTRVCKVLDNGVGLNPRDGPAPLRDGVASTRVSLFGSVFGSLRDFILSSRSRSYMGS